MSRVLVVDDDSDIRGLVRELLERAGHDVIDAPDGNEGLRLFYAEQPDLVILDVSMPGLDGWGSLERIRELSDVPVLMLTARAEELDKVRGLRAGADDYVTKPFGRQELLARVDAQLRRTRAEQAPPETYADGFVVIDFLQRAVRAGDARRRADPARVPPPDRVRAQPEPGSLARPAARAGVGRSSVGRARPGEALRRVPTAQARCASGRRLADRDDAGLRLPLPAGHVETARPRSLRPRARASARRARAATRAGAGRGRSCRRSGCSRPRSGRRGARRSPS